MARDDDREKIDGETFRDYFFEPWKREAIWQSFMEKYAPQLIADEKRITPFVLRLVLSTPPLKSLADSKIKGSKFLEIERGSLYDTAGPFE